MAISMRASSGSVARAAPATPAAVMGARCVMPALARRAAPGSAAPAPRPLRRPPSATPTPPTPAVFVAGGAAGDPEMAAFQAAQASAARPSAAEEARTLLDQGRFGVLSTLSADAGAAGFPSASVVEYACDGSGRPIFAVSGLSAHTADLRADGRVALTVQAPSFHSMDCARLTLQGVAAAVSDAEKPRLREIFLKKYPSAFYVDFGDFQWFRVERVARVRFNGGFGRAPQLSVEDYLAARPDPVAAFSAPVCGHMNADHVEDSKAMVKHYCGLAVESVRMLDLDRLGINCSATRAGQTFKLRLPFPHPAEDRKAIKEVIVEMTKKAKGAAATAARTPGGTA